MAIARTNKVQLIKYAPPPPELPTYGRFSSQEISFIGRTNYVAALEEKRFIFGIKRTDRRRHLYIIGKSGVGKSKLQELLIRQDIAYGYGLCLIDPHGELIDSISHFIPEERMNDVCIIDPTDIAHPVLFNPLRDIDQSFKYQFTQGLIEIMSKQFSSNWTARLEHLFRFTTLALLDYPDASMIGMILMLTDAEYRAKVVASIQDDMVRRFWEVEFKEWGERYENDAIIPLINRLNQLLSDPMISAMFNQKENKIVFEDLINQNKIILINLARGEIGEENARFLGSLFVIKLKQVGMHRAKMTPAERKDFYVYVDEFPTIATDTFENLLSEARKYGMNLTISHQYLGQLSPRLQAAVLGNTGNLIAFRVGGEDAVKLKPEFAPVFDVKDMINLGTGEFYMKMTIDGESYDPFSAEALRVLEPTHGTHRNEIYEASRQKFSRS